jgi:hypothetical protein
MRAAVAIVGCIVALFVARAARAQPGAVGGGDATAEALYEQAQLDEQHGEYAQALERYRASFAASPSSRYAQRAQTRADWLQDHSEGGFVPLARLEGVRRDPAIANDPSAIDALAHDLEAFPSGLVRVEARMLVAEAWLGRMHRPDDGMRELRAVADDPSADPLTARQAAHALVEALVDAGALDAAVREAHARANQLDPRYVKKVERTAHRRMLRLAAGAEITLVLVLAGAALVTAARRGRLADVALALRRLAPVAIAFVVYVAFAGGILASSYETGNAKPFLVLGMAALPLVLLARAWSAAGSPRTWARGARAAACGASVVAAAFVLLDAIDPAYLEDFGL